MSRIVELIAELCPDGVEYRKLGEIADIGTGSSNTQDQDPAGIYPFYVRSPEVKRSISFEFDETAIVTAGDGDVGKVFHFVEGRYALHQRAYRVKPTNSSLDAKFLYHYMKANFRAYVEQKACSATVKSLRKPMFQNFEIPVPPIEVQREIVCILDTFAALTDTLTEELNCRKQQYAYYRDRLLSLESLEALDGKPVEMVRLGDVSRVLRGKRLTKKQLQEDGKFPVFHGGLSPIGFFSEKNRDAKCVMVINVGASAGTVGYSDCDFWSSDGCYCLENSSRIAPRFLYAVLKSKEYEIRSKVRHAGIPTLDAKILECLEIPVPSLETQRKVVDILDRFDALTTSLTDGIPAEIEARRSQYEYYRDRLLDFPHKGSVAV